MYPTINMLPKKYILYFFIYPNDNSMIIMGNIYFEFLMFMLKFAFMFTIFLFNIYLFIEKKESQCNFFRISMVEEQV